MFTKRFWKDAAERVISTFAQALVGTLVVAGATPIGWPAALTAAGIAALVSLLKCLVAAGAADSTVSPASLVEDSGVH